MVSTARYPKTAFVYPGSKALLLPKILNLIPEHEVYVDAFGGSGATILGRPTPSPLEIYNDIDSHLTNFFIVVTGSGYPDLVDRISRTPVLCDGLIDQAAKVLLEGESNPVDRAWAWTVLSNQTRNFHHPLARKEYIKKLNRRPHSDDKRWLSMPYRLNAIRRRFKGVHIHQLEWQRALNTFDGDDTFFFLDPPYLTSTRTPHLYAAEMSDSDHQALLSAVIDLKGRVLLCGYPSALYDRALIHWRRIEVLVQRKLEVMWLNF